MSGGHFAYKQYAIERIAEEIELLIQTNNSNTVNEFGDTEGRHYSPETIAEFKAAAVLLRRAYVYASNIDWLVSGDTGEESFMDHLQAQLRDLK